MSLSKVFDLEELRALLGEDEAALEEIVAAFVAATEELMPQLDSCCTAGDSARLHFYVHQLKGSAGSVRATALYRELDAFEEELRNGCEVDCAARLSVVRGLFWEFAAAAERYCPRMPPRDEGVCRTSPRGDLQ